MSTLDDAIEYIRLGQREEGRQILEELLETDENNEEIWFWLTAVVDNNDDREICLDNVLALTPNHELANKWLGAVQAGNFDVNEFVSEAFEEQEELEPLPESTFLDDFALGEETEFEDDELELPPSMGKAAKKKGGPFNKRLLLLVGVVLLLVFVAVAGAAAYFLLGGDDGTTPGGAPAGQETPAEVEPQTTPTPTLSPTPAPTDTPTATFTPALELPTPKPKDPPTPTATRVVSPTPSN